MTTTYLEHANLTVPDIDKAIEFLQTLEPSFYVRQDQTEPGQHRWVHFGNEHVYIALQAPELNSQAQLPRRTYQHYGVNHLGWVVDNFDAVVQRLDAKGYRLGLMVEPHPARKRAYYFDDAGFEWEIIQYTEKNDDKRNDYESA